MGLEICNREKKIAACTTSKVAQTHWYQICSPHCRFKKRRKTFSGCFENHSSYLGHLLEKSCCFPTDSFKLVFSIIFLNCVTSLPSLIKLRIGKVIFLKGFRTFSLNSDAKY